MVSQMEYFVLGHETSSIHTENSEASSSTSATSYSGLNLGGGITNNNSVSSFLHNKNQRANIKKILKVNF